MCLLLKYSCFTLAFIEATNQNCDHAMSSAVVDPLLHDGHGMDDTTNGKSSWWSTTNSRYYSCQTHWTADKRAFQSGTSILIISTSHTHLLACPLLSTHLFIPTHSVVLAPSTPSCINIQPTSKPSIPTSQPSRQPSSKPSAPSSRPTSHPRYYSHMTYIYCYSPCVIV